MHRILDLDLNPSQRGSGPVCLIASANAEEGDLEMLMSESADTALLDFGVELQRVPPGWYPVGS